MNYFNIISMAGILSLISSFFHKQAQHSRSDASLSTASHTLYDFKLNSLDGEEIDFSKYKGKKVVLINVASKCGNTPQYAVWQKFHEEKGDKVVVLGFPANEFGGQEPGSNGEIAEFCKKNYGVSFQMFEKIIVKGDGQHPLYQWLSKKELNGWNDKVPTWNFCKYVVNENGELTHFFGDKIVPTSEAFLKAIE